jgi:hypothetical protein
MKVSIEWGIELPDDKEQVFTIKASVIQGSQGTYLDPGDAAEIQYDDILLDGKSVSIDAFLNRPDIDKVLIEEAIFEEVYLQGQSRDPS